MFKEFIVGGLLAVGINGILATQRIFSNLPEMRGLHVEESFRYSNFVHCSCFLYTSSRSI